MLPIPAFVKICLKPNSLSHHSVSVPASNRWILCMYINLCCSSIVINGDSVMRPTAAMEGVQQCFAAYTRSVYAATAPWGQLDGDRVTRPGHLEGCSHLIAWPSGQSLVDVPVLEFTPFSFFLFIKLTIAVVNSKSSQGWKSMSKTSRIVRFLGE